jgi:hypothetical protein
MDYADNANAERRLHQQLKLSEFAYACTILSTPDSKTLSEGEFILLELMRLGITDRDQIDSFKERFSNVVQSGSNVVSVEDLVKSGMIDVTNALPVRFLISRVHTNCRHFFSLLPLFHRISM